MPIRIEQSDGTPDIDDSSWVFFGPPKIGNTTLAHGFPQSIFLATSAREVKAIKTPFMLIDTWEKTLESTKDLVNTSRRKYKHIAVDVVDSTWTNCIKYVCKGLDIKHPSEAGYGRGVDMIDLEFKKWIGDLVASDYGLIFISHLQTKEIIKDGRPITKTVSTLPDRARRIILPLISNIGCIEILSRKVIDRNTNKASWIEYHGISFEPSESLEAGSRDGVLPATLPLSKDPRISYQLFKDYYTGRRKK